MKKFFYLCFVFFIASCSKDRLIEVPLPVDVFGCTDPNAENYNAEATEDDGSCLFAGCTDVLATNYDPNANINDGSCLYDGLIGCSDSAAINYDSGAIGCGSPPVANNVDCCVYPVLGCTDPLAFNYNPKANVDDGSCIDVVLGCTDPQAVNYDPAANTDDGSCEYSTEISLNSDLYPLFESRCMPCHAPGAQPPVLLPTKNSYNSIMGYVNVESPESSILYQSVSGGLDLVMPLNATPLTEEEIGLILGWIEDGALQN